MESADGTEKKSGKKVPRFARDDNPFVLSLTPACPGKRDF